MQSPESVFSEKRGEVHTILKRKETEPIESPSVETTDSLPLINKAEYFGFCNFDQDAIHSNSLPIS